MPSQADIRALVPQRRLKVDIGRYWKEPDSALTEMFLQLGQGLGARAQILVWH